MDPLAAWGTAIALGTLVLTGIAAYPTIEEWWKRTRRGIRVRQITQAADPDGLAALELLARRIPEHERDSAEDILRWFREVDHETKRGTCRLQDYFLIGAVRDHVAGFAYVHYYPLRRMAFFSYLVVDDEIPEARDCYVSTAILSKLVRELARGRNPCRQIVTEVESPDALRGPAALRARARIKHFKMLASAAGLTLRVFDVGYSQPRVSLDIDSAKEAPMCLLCAFLADGKKISELASEEYGKVIDFLVEDIYGDQFQHDPELDRAYRSYLQTWGNRMKKRSTQPISLL
ncbi:MAG TPA: hypothetical protein VG734_23370 [Lacunisphaera sp.]|nr:hypothetical protein [Lacunisphaera sp.]